MEKNIFDNTVKLGYKKLHGTGKIASYIQGSLYPGFVVSRVHYIQGLLYPGFIISRVFYIQG